MGGVDGESLDGVDVDTEEVDGDPDDPAFHAAGALECLSEVVEDGGCGVAPEEFRLGEPFVAVREELQGCGPCDDAHHGCAAKP